MRVVQTTRSLYGVQVVLIYRLRFHKVLQRKKIAVFGEITVRLYRVYFRCGKFRTNGRSNYVSAGLEKYKSVFKVKAMVNGKRYTANLQYLLAKSFTPTVFFLFILQSEVFSNNTSSILIKIRKRVR